MATEVPKYNSSENINPPPNAAPGDSVAPAPVASAPPSGPTILPPYPEMIMAAIEALNDQNGSNKSSISKQIEATYGSLPMAHTTLLTHHLNRLKATGQLILQKNNYMKPDPNAPPRRGRGRPPKPKPNLPAGTILPPPRPRGRPPKPRDPLAPPPPPKADPASSGSGRKRGRPPKAATAGVSQSPNKEAKTGLTQVPPGTAPRGRGRPPKVKPSAAAQVGA